MRSSPTNAFRSVYVAGQVLKKLLRTFPDKVEGQEGLAAAKAELIYGALEAEPDVYRIMADRRVRSRMNICFRVALTEDVEGSEQEFLRLAEERGLTGLKGHRSKKGIRASNYNSITLEGARKLADFLREYTKR